MISQKRTATALLVTCPYNPDFRAAARRLFDSPITTLHPIDSDIRLVEIGPGFDPANEQLLSHAGLSCKIGPGFDPGHAPLLSHEWLDWEFGSPIEVTLTGISGASNKTRQFLTTVGNDLTYEVLALLAYSTRMWPSIP